MMIDGHENLTNIKSFQDTNSDVGNGTCLRLLVRDFVPLGPFHTKIKVKVIEKKTTGFWSRH